MKTKLILLLALPIIFFSLFFTVQAAEIISDKHYKIKLNNTEDGSIVADPYDIIVGQGSILPSEEKQEFLAKLYSLTDELIINYYFTMDRERSMNLKVPYSPIGKEIKIYNSADETKELFTLNVQVFASVCGDSICQDHESFESCTKDCLSGGADDFCDHIADGTCDPDCQNIKDADEDCTGENPAVAHQNALKALEAENNKKLAEDINDKLSIGGLSNYAKNIPNFKFIAIFGLLIIIIIALIIYFARKKE